MIKPKNLIGKYFHERFDLYRVIEVDESRGTIELISIPELAIQTTRDIADILDGTDRMKPYKWSL